MSINILFLEAWSHIKASNEPADVRITAKITNTTRKKPNSISKAVPKEIRVTKNKNKRFSHTITE
ncbi:MAG: hypothetical protein M3162_01645 [Thermoproteota archaeon]|nr:hypothetical protein [Thermoproteota archaeon]